jgi:dolichol-phosphate mannosyltransferase
MSSSIAFPHEAIAEAPLAPQPLPRTLPHVFVVPAYNEADNLPRLLADLESRPALFPLGSCVVVVDDGSDDGTDELVRAYTGPLDVELCRLESNQGPGAAFRVGFQTALERTPGEAFVVTLEADTTSDLDALPEMIERAAAGADLVVASWAMVRVSFLRRFLSAGAAFVVRHALGLHTHTVSSFYRVYRASCLRGAFASYGDGLIKERGFACKAELLAKLSALGGHVEEVTVELDTSRRVGNSKMPVLRTIFAYWRLLARLRFSKETAAA